MPYNATVTMKPDTSLMSRYLREMEAVSAAADPSRYLTLGEVLDAIKVEYPEANTDCDPGLRDRIITGVRPAV